MTAAVRLGASGFANPPGSCAELAGVIGPLSDLQRKRLEVRTVVAVRTSWIVCRSSRRGAP